jgi:glutathione S-transferase
MKLYVMPGACSLASHIALIWAGAEFRLHVLSHEDAGGDAYRKINPKAAVPALVLDDGTVITESLAILDYIADRFPDARLGADPSDKLGRAKLHERLAELVSDVHKAWGPVFVPERFVCEAGNQDDAKRAAFVQLDGQYGRLNGLMQDKTWSLFGRRTVADAYLYVMCSWKDKTPTLLAAFPALAAFKAQLDQDPGVRRALKEEGLT